MLRLEKIGVYVSIITLICIPICITLIFPNQSSAHPGNTAADGGHYCWTNCEYWGYTYGTRHFHNTYSAPTYSPSLYEQGITNGKKHAEEINRAYIEGSASIAGKTKGYEDGHSQKVNSSWDSTVSDVVCDKEVTFETIQQYEYKTAFQSSYETNCTLVYDAKYKTAYETAYDEGDKKFNDEELVRIAEEKANTEKRNDDIMWSVLVIGGVSIPSYYIYTTYWKSKR